MPIELRRLERTLTYSQTDGHTEISYMYSSYIIPMENILKGNKSCSLTVYATAQVSYLILNEDKHTASGRKCVNISKMYDK